MNPPFTRKQFITKEFRADLTARFSDYSSYASKEMGYYGYFVLLADRFLKVGGRLAIVLPAAVLQQKSTAGLRRLLSERYVLDATVFSHWRSAFSEDTSLREILLVATKLNGEPAAGKPCAVGRLKVMPDDLSISKIADAIQRPDQAASFGEILEVSAIDQERFRQTLDWRSLTTASEKRAFDFPSKKGLTALRNVVPSIIQGIRFHDGSDKVDVKNTLKNTLVSRERNARTRIDWKIISEDAKKVLVQSQRTAAEVRIPKSALRPATRSASGMTRMEVTEPPDYIVVDRFPDDELFWDASDADDIVQRRADHIRRRECFLITAGYGNIDITGSGTSLLAFVSRTPMVPTWSLWSFRVGSYDTAQLLALWWNSSFSLATLISSRTEVRGSVMKWRKETLLDFPVLWEKTLPRESRDELLRVYQEVCSVTFPSLIEQLRDRHASRKEIEMAIARALEWTEVEREERLNELYAKLASQFEALKMVMGRD